LKGHTGERNEGSNEENGEELEPFERTEKRKRDHTGAKEWESGEKE
jgi:hypothetical protein